MWSIECSQLSKFNFCRPKSKRLPVGERPQTPIKQLDISWKLQKSMLVHYIYRQKVDASDSNPFLRCSCLFRRMALFSTSELDASVRLSIDSRQFSTSKSPNGVHLLSSGFLLWPQVLAVPSLLLSEKILNERKYPWEQRSEIK